MPDNLASAGLLESLHAIAFAKQRRSADEMNAALTRFTAVAQGVLLPVIRRELRSRYVGGLDSVILEAEDVLNILLLKLVEHATTCFATNDAMAFGWLQTTATNIVEDHAKTARRRWWSLFDRLRDLGRDVRSWNADDEDDQAERNRDE